MNFKTLLAVLLLAGCTQQESTFEVTTVDTSELRQEITALQTQQEQHQQEVRDAIEQFNRINLHVLTAPR